jgi:hypothetical protein
MMELKLMMEPSMLGKNMLLHQIQELEVMVKMVLEM